MFYFQALTALKEEGEGGEEKKQSLALCRAHPFGTWGHRWSTRPCCGCSSVLLLHPCLHPFIFSLHVPPPHPSLLAPISQRGTRAGSRSGVLVEVVRGGCESLSPSSSVGRAVHCKPSSSHFRAQGAKTSPGSGAITHPMPQMLDAARSQAKKLRSPAASGSLPQLFWLCHDTRSTFVGCVCHGSGGQP